MKDIVLKDGELMPVGEVIDGPPLVDAIVIEKNGKRYPAWKDPKTTTGGKQDKRAGTDKAMVEEIRQDWAKRPLMCGLCKFWTPPASGKMEKGWCQTGEAGKMVNDRCTNGKGERE